MKKILIVILILLLVFTFLRITTSTFENTKCKHIEQVMPVSEYRT